MSEADPYYNDHDCACRVTGNGSPENPYTLAFCEVHTWTPGWRDFLGWALAGATVLYFGAHVYYAVVSGGWPIHG